jgi:3-oxoacyl-[acyl-carrier-protein] synthase III
MAGETEFAIDLAEGAILDCLKYSRYSASEIDLLISANISRYDGPGFRFVFEPSTSARLKRKLGFRNALAFDVTAACAGMFAAIYIVDAMIRTGMVRRGLVVSGEYITHLTRTAQKEIEGSFDQRLACLTLGDAGAALILEADPSGSQGFRALEMFTLGEFSSYCIAKPTDQPHGGAIMRTDMVNLSTVSFKHGNGHAADVMRRSGWKPSDIRHILVHQTSRLSIDGAARELRRRLGREVFRGINMVNNLAERGNTASTSHFVALADSIRAGEIREGDKVVFGILASGLTVGTGLYTCDGLAARMRVSPPADTPVPRPLLSSVDRYFARDGGPRVRIASVGLFAPPADSRPDTLDLLDRAVRNCLGPARSIDDVDLLIYCGVYRSEFICEPAIAALAAGKLGLGKTSSPGRALAFDVMNGALGFLNACFCAIAMLQARRHSRALVVAAEVENNAADPSAGLRGLREAASAVLLEVSDNGGEGFGGFLFHDDPAHLGAFESHLAQSNCRTTMRYRRGGPLEPACLANLEAAFRSLLDREGITPEQVAAVLPPQTSVTFLRALRERLPVRSEIVVDAATPDQDLFTSSLAFSLKHLRSTNPPRAGDVGIVLGTGTGIQTIAAVYHF